MESIGKRQRELVKSNANILDWAMKTVSGKKKGPLPNIKIYDFIPHTIVPKDVTNPFIPFTNPEELKKYKREQAQKAKSPGKPPKKTKKN